MRSEFYLSQLAPLVGGTISGTVVDDEGEFFGLEVKLPGGRVVTLWLLSDDEGNGPGSFSLEDA